MQYYATYEEDNLCQLIRFEEDAVELDLPIDPPTIVNHWKILPLTYPKVLAFCTSVLWVRGKLEA